MRSISLVCLGAAAVGATSTDFDPTSEALAEDDSCEAGDESCALNALQHNVLKVTSVAQSNQTAAGGCFQRGMYYFPNFGDRTEESSADDCQTRCKNEAGCAHFSYWPDGGCQMQASSAQSRGISNGKYAAVQSGPPVCGSGGSVVRSSQAASLDSPANSQCKQKVEWAAQSGKGDPHAGEWYSQMKLITGVDYQQATQDDFQRLFFCAPPGGDGCGTAPLQCSKPPCGTCFGGAPPPERRAGCGGAEDTSIGCKPPSMPVDYNGMDWPTTTVSGTGPFHIFAIGDWGGMDGTLSPIEGRPPLIAYAGGNKPGPSVFPRTRWNKHHTREMCDHKAFTACYGNGGAGLCPMTYLCGYVEGVDDKAQLLVAEAMRQRAPTSRPEFILNVGDNFYWGGIEQTCGTTPMDQLSFTAYHQFTQIFEGVYTGDGMENAAWFSVLGNHDWGGRQFTNGWDQQIAYTWQNKRWVMPAIYWKTKADFPDAGFSIDMYMIDTNVFDAHDPPRDSEHNICGSAHNPPGATCGKIGGPTSVYACKSWFQDLWHKQKAWLESALSEAKGDWQIVVTHFPCGTDSYWFRSLHDIYGLDLLVTGHRHDQELHRPHSGALGGLACFVTGGGGGISSEATPNPSDKREWFGEGQYGFFDLTVTKDTMKIESINYDGTVLKTHDLTPTHRKQN